jgi:exodeoxyribonuclease V alpha subunit
VSSGLFYNLIKAIKPGAKLIVSGDFAQLPPLNWGNPFNDYLQKDNFSIFYLTKILRQAEKSGVVTSANLIRDGIDPLNGEKHFKTVYGEDQNMYFLFRSDKEDLHSIAVKTYLKTIEDPNIGVENCCILSSRKDGCLNSSRKINDIIQNKLIPDDVPMMKYGESKKFKVGARVMQVVNSYDKNVFNGDIGTVKGIVYNEDGDECLEVEYPEQTVLYTKEDLNELELAYSFSIHKSQGSEYHTVIIVLDSSGFLLLDNCLLYTAVSRAKSRCLLLSDPASYNRCLQINRGNSRNTWSRYF